MSVCRGHTVCFCWDCPLSRVSSHAFCKLGQWELARGQSAVQCPWEVCDDVQFSWGPD